MTNNPTIDGVSRELLERIRQRLIDKGEISDFGLELFQLLNVDTPAVERQEPVAEVVATGGPHDREDRVLVELQAELPPVGTKIYAAPPEAAALQSTIARLEAQLNKAIDLDFQRRERITQLESEKEFAAATYQAARDRIAELESGRGEPVANCFERRNGAGEWVNDSKVWIEGSPCSGILKECEKYPDLYRIRLAYTAPPAPVAVVMPDPVGEVVEFGKGLKEVSWVKGKLPGLGSKLYTSAPALLLPGRRTADDFQSKNAQYDCADALADTWNACLDTTAALNTPKAAEWHDVAGDDEGLAQ